MKHVCRMWLLPLILILVSPLPSKGGEREEKAASGTVWSWGDVVRRVEAGTALLKAAQAGVEASQALQNGSGRWPNPELGLEAVGFGISQPWLGPEEASVTVRQAIPMGGRLRSEQAVAAVASLKAAAEADDTLAGLRARASLRFLDALVLKERAELENERLSLSEKAATLVLARIRAGALPEAEKSRSDAAVAMARLELAQARRQATAALGTLAAVWGGAPSEVGGVAGAMDSLPVPEPLPTVLQRMTQAPGLRAVEAEVEVQGRQAEVEEAAAIPDLAVGAGGVWFGAFDEAALVLSLEWPLPLFDRNQGRVDEARARERQARFQVEAWKEEWTATLLDVHSKYEQYYEKQSVLGSEIVPALQRAAEAVERGFQNGQLTTLDLLESHRELLEAKLGLLEARQQAWEALLEMNYMTGQLGKHVLGGRP